MSAPKTLRTLKDLIDANVWFLQGKIPQSPNHLGPIDDETQPFVGPLIAINVMGSLLTTASQPGLVQGDLRQRSFLVGLTPESVAMKLHTRLNRMDLILTAWPVATRIYEATPHGVAEPRGGRFSGGVLVTQDGRRDYTFAGHFLDEFSHWRRILPTKVADRIGAGLCEVTAIDPVWGRDPMDEKGLFTALMKILCVGKAAK